MAERNWRRLCVRRRLQRSGQTLNRYGLLASSAAKGATPIASADRARLDHRVLLAPRGYPASPKVARLVAAVARTGDLTHFHAWRAGNLLPPLVTDDAEAEGYGELARQSAGRVASVLEANGMNPTLPLVIWRRGQDWRALSAVEDDIGARIRRDQAGS
jgi:hypothetical protein